MYSVDSDELRTSNLRDDQIMLEQSALAELSHALKVDQTMCRRKKQSCKPCIRNREAALRFDNLEQGLRTRETIKSQPLRIITLGGQSSL